MKTAMTNMIAYMDGLLKIEDNLILEFKDAPQKQIQGIKDNWQQLNMIKEMAIFLLEQERKQIIVANEEGVKYGCETRNPEYWRAYDGEKYFNDTFTNP